MTPGIWTALFAEHPLPEALRELASLGWAAFEVSSEHLCAIEESACPEREIEDAQAAADALGVVLPQAHAYLPADVAHPDRGRREADLARLVRHIEIASRLGTVAVVVHPGGGTAGNGQDAAPEVFERNVAAFRRLAEVAGERGVGIGIENMMFAGASKPEDLLELVQAVDRPALGITLDTSHAHVMGLCLPDAIRQVGPYLLATHVSDNDGSADQHRTPGNGAIEWRGVMAALREVGYRRLLNLEVPGERHPDVSLRRLKALHARRVMDWLLG